MRHTPHLYLAPPWPDNAIPLPPPATHHLLKVLRVGSGTTVTYTDGAGRFGEGRLAVGHRDPRQSSRPDTTVLRGEERVVPPPSVAVTLAVAPPHDKERLRFMVEKLGELEVRRIAFLRARFGAGRLPDQSRTTSWAISALEQSQGAWLMEVSGGWVEVGALDGGAWFADRGAAKLEGPLPGQLTIAIGPEGGWAPEEIPEGARRIGLGRTVLRVETSAIVAAGVIRSLGPNPVS